MQIQKSMKTLLVIIAILAVALSPLLILQVNGQVTLGTVVIRADGSIYPESAPITQRGNIYIFTDDLYATIKIQKSGIILDGAGYTLHGSYNGSASDIGFIGDGTGKLSSSTQVAQYTVGIDLINANVNSVVIENLNIKNFSIGMYMWTKNNTVVGNKVSDNIIGILLSGNNETVARNLIANNGHGIFFGFNNPNDTIPTDIMVYRNSFVGNKVQLNGCECRTYNATEPPHNWDNGILGNFWSNYNGTDTNHDGIGDTPYKLDVLDQDRYPIMQNIAKAPAVFPKPQINWVAIALSFAVLALATLLAAKFLRRRRKILR